MDERDWEAWGPQEPPRSFADGVVRAARTEQGKPPASARPPPRPRGSRVLAGLLVAAAMVAVIGLGVHRSRANAHGAVTADARQEVHVGTRALAVLEKGASVRWDGDAIAQSNGDVFWRVEPGARFVVKTPAADVAVQGTCFRVKVTDGEDAMTSRDAKSAGVGAVLAAAAFVGVYEGKVAVSHAGQSVNLTAGQAARAGADGVRRTSGGPSDDKAAESVAAPGSADEQALAEANANLVDNVQAYRRRLEAIEAEKRKLEKELAEAQSKLSDGGQPKSEFDLSQADWKELAKEGEVRFRIPCSGPRNDFSLSPDKLSSLGLAPQDAPILQRAYSQSYARAWGAVQPLCSQALGGVDASRLGLQACMSVLAEMQRTQSSSAYDEDIREASEIMAGLRAAPAPGANVDPILQAYLALAREPQSIVSEVAQSLGPDDARRVVFADSGCWWDSSHGAGPRPTP